MKPRYEIHSIGMPEIVEPTEESKAEQRNRAARALFSATEMVNSNHFQTEFGRTVPMTKYFDYANRYRTGFQSQERNVAQAISAAYGHDPDPGDVVQVFAGMKRAGSPDLRDAWDTSLQARPGRAGIAKRNTISFEALVRTNNSTPATI